MQPLMVSVAHADADRLGHDVRIAAGAPGLVRVDILGM
jgi:hypothetical protein